MAYETTEALTEGAEVEFTMVTDSGVEREGCMEVTEITGTQSAKMVNGEGQTFDLNFHGMTTDEIAQIRVNDKYIGDIVEMEGY